MASSSLALSSSTSRSLASPSLTSWTLASVSFSCLVSIAPRREVMLSFEGSLSLSAYWQKEDVTESKWIWIIKIGNMPREREREKHLHQIPRHGHRLSGSTKFLVKREILRINLSGMLFRRSKGLINLPGMLFLLRINFRFWISSILMVVCNWDIVKYTRWHGERRIRLTFRSFLLPAKAPGACYKARSC